MRRGSRKNRLVDIWLGIPALNILASFRPRRKYPEKIERVGILCSFTMGDTLISSAVVHSLRRQFPKAQLVYFAGRQNIAAAELIPDVDKVVMVDILRPWITLPRMRAERIDLLLDFTPWQRITAVYSLLSGARFIAGFSTHKQYRHRGYDALAEHSRNLHEIDNFRSVLRAVGIPADHEPVLPAALPPPEITLRGDAIVVFHPWASGMRSVLREWPEVHWITLARYLAGEKRTIFVVTGAPCDQKRSEVFVQKLRAEGLQAEVFMGRNELASLCHVLLAAELVVSVNTGVMHLAAILGAPTISLNGPTNNERWGPVGQRAIGVQPLGGECGHLHLGFEMNEGPIDCMERILPEQVIAAADALREPIAMAHRESVHSSR